MKKIIVMFTIFASVTSFAQSNLKTLHTVVKSEMSKQDQTKFCISESNADSNICLMTRAGASEYCKQRGLKLPTARDFSTMAQSYGAYLGSESCG